MMNRIVKAYVDECVAILRERNIVVRVDKIEMSNRMTTTLGLMQISNRCGRLTYTLKLNAKAFIRDSEELRETVFHEVCHAADHANYNSVGHGLTWKSLMCMVGLKPDTYASKEKIESIGYAVKRVRKFSKLRVICDQCEKRYKLTKVQYARIDSYKCMCGGKLKTNPNQ
jgi:predicted SprT family Zn-dependent metalloprotease